jgi:hypothetical protein
MAERRSPSISDDLKALSIEEDREEQKELKRSAEYDNAIHQAREEDDPEKGLLVSLIQSSLDRQAEFCILLQPEIQPITQDQPSSLLLLL